LPRARVGRGRVCRGEKKKRGTLTSGGFFEWFLLRKKGMYLLPGGGGCVFSSPNGGGVFLLIGRRGRGGGSLLLIMEKRARLVLCGGGSSWQREGVLFGGFAVFLWSLRGKNCWTGKKGGFFFSGAFKKEGPFFLGGVPVQGRGEDLCPLNGRSPCNGNIFFRGKEGGRRGFYFLTFSKRKGKVFVYRKSSLGWSFLFHRGRYDPFSYMRGGRGKEFLP